MYSHICSARILHNIVPILKKKLVNIANLNRSSHKKRNCFNMDMQGYSSNYETKSK